jgi:hypothetical protein
MLMFRPTLRISAQANVVWCVQNSGESRTMLKRKLKCRVKTEGPEVKEESEEIASESESASDEKLVAGVFKLAEKLVTYVATSQVWKVRLVFCFCPTRLFKGCSRLKYLISDGAMGANVDITRFCRLIVLVTNRSVVRDLEVSVPPTFMSFRRASFWTCPKNHTYVRSLNFLGRLGLGWAGVGLGGLRWAGWGWRWGWGWVGWGWGWGRGWGWGWGLNSDW